MTGKEWETLLREKIATSGKTQEEIAEAVGVSQPTVSLFLSKQMSLRFWTAVRLLDYFGYEIRKKEP